MFKRLTQTFDRWLGRGVITDELYDELEEALIEADTPILMIQEILEELRMTVRREKITDPSQMQARLRQMIADRFRVENQSALNLNGPKPRLIIFVGVNGVGKTTSLAKLAQRLKSQGQRVLIASGDTFRAAAIDQLAIWAERIGVEIVKAQPGSDSAAVIFDAVQAAKARGIDVVLADTAGRQHSKDSLMNELAKVIRVAEKGLGRAPDEVLLVLDSNTGQNALRQAEEFIKHTGVTGIILTKLDGTARGGALIGVFQQSKVPVKLVGYGEQAHQLKDFDPAEFAAGLFENS